MSSKGDINAQIAGFTAQLKRRQLAGSKTVALATANLLARFISARRWTTTEGMIEQVRELGRQLEAAQPHEFTCGNVVRRVLKNLRTVDEAVGAVENADERETSSSMFGLLTMPAGDKQPDNARSRDLKAAVIEDIHTLIEEITNEDALFKAGVEMVNDNDTILTPCPSSQQILDFLLRAAQKRVFSVLVTECAPNGQHDAKVFAEKLTKAGIPTQVIPDASVHAVMGKISKVIISPRAVLANGGCVTPAGMALACQAAKHFNRPVLVLAGSYKLSPLYPFDVEKLIEVGNSGKVIGFEEWQLMDQLQVINPLFDYVAPEQLDIILTTDGGYSPNFVYRIVLDNYCTEDQTL